MNVFLGVDVGTTVCKALAVSTEGEEIQYGRAATPWKQVATGAEVGAYDLLDSVVSAIGDCLEGLASLDIAGVGVTSFAETGVLLDKHDRPLHDGIAWFDNRGEDEKNELPRGIGVDGFVDVTGLPLTAKATCFKLRWLADAYPDLMSAGWRWLNVAEWVVYGLGGLPVSELSLASRTGMLDRERGTWWPEMVDWSGLSGSALSTPVAAGTPAGRLSHPKLPTATGALLTVAGHDHLCAALGGGAVRNGDIFDSCGTAEGIVGSVDPPLSATRVHDAVAMGLSVGWHVLPNTLALLGGELTGRGLGRILALLGVQEHKLDELDSGAARLTWGDMPADLRVVDLAGDMTSIVGIGERVSPEMVWKAATAEVASTGGTLVERIGRLTAQPKRVLVAGGWSRSATLMQAKKERMGEVNTVATQEAGARGAAVLAGRAARAEVPLSPLRAGNEC